MSTATRKASAPIILALLVVFTMSVSPVYGAFIDTRGHWASSAIESLSAQQIIGGYPDNTFRPEQPMTRAEFAKLIATAFEVETSEGNAFTDTADHWARAQIAGLVEAGYVDGYPDGSFRPDQPITRAESVQILAEVSGLTDLSWFGSGSDPAFTDVNVDHWAYPAVQAMEHMGLLPVFTGDQFAPDTSLTRAEAAWMTYQAMRIGQESGTVTFVDVPTRRVTVKTDEGRVRDFRTSNETIIVRGDALQSLDSLEMGDRIIVLADRFGTPRLVAVEETGILGIASEDLTQQLAEAILEIYSVEELQQMVAGDWSVATSGIQREVAERLVAAGMTAEETEALLEQDWTALQQAVVARLKEELKVHLNISDELVQALLARDWTAVREQAKLDVAEHLLNQLLSTMDAAA